MKIVGRIILGLLGTAGITVLLLAAIDAPYTEQLLGKLMYVAADNTDAAVQAEKTGQEEMTATPSIRTKEHQVVYQAQQARDAGQQSDMGNGQAGGDIQENGGTEEENRSLEEPAATEERTGKGTDKEKKKKKEFQTVDQDYFSDAVFIGDSRTVGMQQSGLLPNATYYAKTGIGIGEILTKRIVYEGGVMLSVQEALSRHTFGKVYIMIGINDMSSGDVDWFREQYQAILDVVRATQPEALIYIQGNIPMSYRTQDMSGSLNNKNLSQRNEASRQLADEKHIFYLDIEMIYADANGHLDTKYTTDGLHVASAFYPRWVDHLLSHAIVE